jgi:hypothetical protein
MVIDQHLGCVSKPLDAFINALINVSLASGIFPEYLLEQHSSLPNHALGCPPRRSHLLRLF